MQYLVKNKYFLVLFCFLFFFSKNYAQQPKAIKLEVDSVLVSASKTSNTNEEIININTKNTLQHTSIRSVLNKTSGPEKSDDRNSCTAMGNIKQALTI